jgi:lactoylglutathione lyase
MNSTSPSINLLVIRSPDIHRAKSFYTTLGLSFELHSHGKGPEHYTSVANEVVFEIYPLTAGQLPTTSTRLGFQVNNVDDLVLLLTQIGGTLVSPPTDSPWGRRAVLRDLDGHTLELTSPIDQPHAGAESQ